MAQDPRSARRRCAGAVLLLTEHEVGPARRNYWFDGEGGPPLQSAMGMLTFYINRAGDNLTKADRAKLEKAKDELRALFDKKEDA